MLDVDCIYNMDCLDGLRLLDDVSVDLTVTSPPYDNLRNYHGYSFGFEDIARELYRVTKVSGTERQTDGTIRKMAAIKNRTGRVIQPYGVRQNIWHYKMGYMKSTPDKIAYKHPAIFPEALAHDHIISWSNPGDLVLDPFSGSGTTAKMAKLTGRKYIGFEISDEYCRIAEERLKHS